MCRVWDTRVLHFGRLCHVENLGVSAGLTAHNEGLAGLAESLGARAGIAAPGLHYGRSCHVAGRWQVLPQRIRQYAAQCSLHAQVCSMR